MKLRNTCAVGSNPLCAGIIDSITLTTSSVTAVWYRNNVVIPKATATKYVAKLYGTYSFTGQDANGCVGSATPIVVHEQFVPAPIITRTGVVLTSSFSRTNQWYQNFAPVSTATSYSLDTSIYAIYSVQAVVNGCKSPMSSYIINIRDSINSINENCPTVTTPTLYSVNTPKAASNVVNLTYEGLDLSVKLYPNPSSTNATVEISGATGSSEISVTDLLGRVIWKSTVGNNKNISLPAGTLAKGVYVVSVTSEGQHQEIKWVINR